MTYRHPDIAQILDMASGLLSWLVPALLLGAAVAPGNASPIAGAVVGNGTADGLLDIDGFGDGSLAKRAMPGAASDEVVRKYEQLGHTQVSEWLFATSADATANLIGPVVKEVFNLNGDPLKHNWQRHLVTRKEEVLIKDWGINDISGTAVSAASDPVNMLDKLTVGRQPTSPAQQLEKWQEERKAQSGLYPRGPNVRYQVHQQTAIPAYYGHQQPFVMGAGYDVTLNIVDGIIIVDEARGPTRRDDGFRIPFNRFPDITSWSEVVFDLWLRIKPVKRPRQSVMTVAPNHGKLNPFSTFEPGLKVKEFLGVEGFLNYVFMVNIREPTEEVSIIKRCLASRTDANQYPGYDDAQRFSVGHW